MLESRSPPTGSPFTDTVIDSRSRPSGVRYGASSSAVTTHGPSVEAKSLPFAGPRPTFISRRWRSRADQSLKIVYRS
jgi:hypothetical protein